jgi:hypothetical protein
VQVIVVTATTADGAQVLVIGVYVTMSTIIGVPRSVRLIIGDASLNWDKHATLLQWTIIAIISVCVLTMGWHANALTRLTGAQSMLARRGVQITLPPSSFLHPLFFLTGRSVNQVMVNIVHLMDIV